MSYSNQISIILQSSKEPIPAQAVLQQLLESEVADSKGFFAWFSDFTHINSIHYIILETKKKLPVTQIMQNIINNILVRNPINSRLARLFDAFFTYYPCFIELLPATLKSLAPSTPYNFSFYDFNQTTIPDLKSCKFIEKTSPRHDNESLSSFTSRVFRSVTEIDYPTELKVPAALQIFNMLAPGIPSQKASEYLPLLLNLMGNIVVIPDQDRLITTLNHLAARISSSLKPDVIEKILFLTFKHKVDDATACMQKLITYYPANQQANLLRQAKTNMMRVDSQSKYFGLKMLGLLSPDEIKLSEATNDADLEKILIVIEIFSLRLSSCTAEEINQIFELAVTCLNNDDPCFVTKTCEVLTNLCKYLSADQMERLFEALSDKIEDRKSVMIISSILNIVLAICKNSNDEDDIKIEAAKFSAKFLFHPNPTVYQLAQAILYYAAKTHEIDFNQLLPLCFAKLQESKEAGASLLVLIKDLLNDSQKSLVGNRSLAIYNELASDELKIPASRVLGQYHSYIENLARGRITLRLYDIVFDTYSAKPKYSSLRQHPHAVTLIENLSPLLDDKVRFFLLKLICSKVTEPYVSGLLTAIIEDIHDKENNHYFLGFLAIAKNNDNFHLYNDDVEVEVNTLSLERFILDIHYNKPANLNTSALVLNAATPT